MKAFSRSIYWLIALQGCMSAPPSTNEANCCPSLARGEKAATWFVSNPGVGWDNLRNKEMGLVADLSFADCRTSEDGLYILPRNVILHVRKESEVEVISEIIDSHNSYSSSVSTLVSADVSSEFSGLSGKFSAEFEHVKSAAIEGKLDIARVQLRYRLYSAKLQPDFQLSKALTNRLTDIVNAIVSNRTRLARYLSDLVVRDFGTHVVTSLDAGGVLEKIDFYEKSSIADRDFMQSKFSASMSVNYLNLLSSTIGSTLSVTTESMNNYKKSVRKVMMRSHGGPLIGSMPKLDEWVGGLKENLVPINREGEALHGVISRRSLPGVPVMHLLQLKREIERAIIRYYVANMVKGCQDPNSANFDPLANLEGPCQGPKTGLNFAGVFQTCEETNPSASLNLCDNYGERLKNPVSGTYSCPTGYEPVHLFSVKGRDGRRCTSKKKTCWIFFTCDDGETCVSSSSSVSTYWCAAAKGAVLGPNSGMVYGGAYANDGRFVNEITDSKSCGQFFRPYQIGRDIQLCLSMDLQAAARYRIPFAGFFACNSGNPLADPKRDVVTARAESPKQCPDGFSQHTLDTIDGCAVMQCVSGRSAHRHLPVRRPPFEEPDYELIEKPIVQIERSGWRWGYNISSHAWSLLGFFGSHVDAPNRVSDETQAPVH